ncbi:hypothetical protein OQA88_11607 [Cercophora sp. LCS_1]
MAIRNRVKRFEAAGMSWKTSAKVNAILVSALSTVLLSALVYGLVVKRDSGVNSTFPIFQGSCQTASGLNIFLHLVLNVLGTLILASSNFFMQLVAAPSRAELDRAHQASRWLDIGVPTLRNFASLSSFKRTSWLVLMASSVPIHLLFNSAIFYVESQRTSFTMTLAAEPFLQGATYYPPGASLWNMKVPGNCTDPINLEVATRCSRLVSPVVGLWDVNGSLVSCSVTQMKSTGRNSTCPDYVRERNNKYPNELPAVCLSDEEYYDPTVCYKGGVGGWPKAWENVAVPSFDPVANGGRRINCTQPATMADAKTCISEVVTPEWQPVNDRSKEDYLNQSSVANTRISKAATAVDKKWERLTFDACRREYLECGQGRGLRNHGDVVVVLMDVFTDARVEDLRGWTRNELFPRMLDADAAFWEDLVPGDALNPLLFSAECTMKQSFTKYEDGTKQCRNSCGSALGYGMSNLEDWQSGGPIVQAESGLSTDPNDYWSFKFWHPYDAWDVQMRSGKNSNLDDRQDRVAYCLAEVLGDNSGEGACIIGMSNVVLLVVTTCVLAKMIQSFFVVRTLVWKENPSPPLITLGDAIDSFLRNPDPTTTRMCTLSQTDFSNSLFSPSAQPLPVTPRPWKSHGARYHSVIPTSSKLLTMALFLTTLIASTTLFALAMQSSKRLEAFGVNSQSFILLDRATQNYSGSFTNYVTLANIPQLLVSLCYLRFNAVLTRIHTAKEWHEMGVAYRALRVTSPRGAQYSRYTLQLPLKWAVPPIVLSIALHFLVSNSIYVFVSEGGYFTTENSQNRDTSIGLSEQAFIGLGYSTSAILLSLAVFSVMALAPVWLGWRYLPGDWKGMGRAVVVGTNSLAISAACHPSELSRGGEEGGIETKGDQSPAFDEEGSLCDMKRGVGSRLAESRVRWGVVRMPDGFYDGMGSEGEVAHLSFGVREDGVQPPVKGKCYV